MKYCFLILTIFCQFQLRAQEEEQVKTVINQLFEGMKKSDTALMRAAFAPGTSLQSVVKNKEGKVMIMTEPIDSFLHAIARPHKEIYDEKISFDLVKIDGEMAMAWTPYRFYVGSRFSHCGVDSYQLAKLNGQWKIIYLVDTRRRQGCE